MIEYEEKKRLSISLTRTRLFSFSVIFLYNYYYFVLFIKFFFSLYQITVDSFQRNDDDRRRILIVFKIKLGISEIHSISKSNYKIKRNKKKR